MALSRDIMVKLCSHGMTFKKSIKKMGRKAFNVGLNSVQVTDDYTLSEDLVT